MIKVLFFLSAGLFFALQTEAKDHFLYQDRKEMFLKAESHHLFEEFTEALAIYLELLLDEPGNSFLNYRAGNCYLNLPGKESAAVGYLEKAILDMDARKRRPTYSTNKAPVDALFLLGSAYHINYRFKDALKMFYRFREVLNPEVYYINVVDEHIQNSLNAIVSTGSPASFIRENLGERINTSLPETNPAVSGNEERIVFTRKLPLYHGIFFSEKTVEGEWSWPEEITAQLGCDGDCHPVSLSWDGKELYLYKSDNLVGNLYVSHYEEGRWTPIKKLNDNINTRFWESHASISVNKDTLYFTSNRPGGYGGLDIYYSAKCEKGDWGPAVNLGPEINTPGNEDAPFIMENGRALYFSSHGHYNIGGYDIFYSTKKEGQWTVPVNLGYGINRPGDDLFFNPVKNGIHAYFARIDNDGSGDKDIYRYTIFSEANPRKFLLRGEMKRKDGLQTGTAARIRIIESVSGDTLYTARPDQLTREYEIMVTPGEWEVVFSEKDHENVVRKINLPPDREENEKIINASLVRTEPVIPGIYTVITDSIILPAETIPRRTLGIEQHHYHVTSKEKISISMRLGFNTDLKVERYIDKEPAGTEMQKIERRRHIYDYEPVPGDNLLRFIHTGILGDVVTEDVLIGFHPPDEETVLKKVPAAAGTDTIPEPEYFETPVPEDVPETHAPGRVVPIWWILILALILLVAFYYKERGSRKKK